MVNYTPRRRQQREDNPFSVYISSMMKRHCLRLMPHECIAKATDRILRARLSGAPVVDDQNRVIGFLSQKDCLKAASTRCYLNSYPRHVQDYMSTTVHAFSTSTRIAEALANFTEHPYKAYPVVDDRNRLQGLVTRHSMLLYIHQIQQNTWFAASHGLGQAPELTAL